LPVVIRVDASLKNSIFDAVSLFDLPKKSAIREDIDQFTKEITNHGVMLPSYPELTIDEQKYIVSCLEEFLL
jgi:dTDP-4-amino-4,6-dideoxygalactose transaminase